MVIVYLARMLRKNADASYNIARGGIWAFAEIGLGITVTGVFYLPKFIEAKGTKLRGIFSSLKRPLPAEGPLGSFIQARKGTKAAEDMELDTVHMIGCSESSVGSYYGEQDVERYPSDEDVHIPATVTSVNATTNPHES